jgi:hypothetical protein
MPGREDTIIKHFPVERTGQIQVSDKIPKRKGRYRMSNNTKWTIETLEFLFRALVREFGPFDELHWNTSRRIPIGMTLDQFKEWCVRMAKAINMKTGVVIGKGDGSRCDDAVRIQIAYAVTMQSTLQNTGNAKAMIYNKAIAHSEGFIGHDMLSPPCISIGRRDANATNRAEAEMSTV